LNKRGQFSIIAALLVTVILVSTVMITYTMILNNSIPIQPQVLTAIDETNFALKQLLGFSVGYYGSVIQVTGDSSFANQSTFNYTTSGLEYIANTHPEWGAGFSLTNLTIQTYWFSNVSYSTGYLDVTYNLTKLGIDGVQYAPSCGLTVQIVNATQSNQTSLVVTEDQNEPVTDLGEQNFQFFQYETANSTWGLVPPSTSPTTYTNGTYQIQPPTGISANSYVVQVTDQRGIIVVASPYSSYNINMTWPVSSSALSSTDYVNNNASDVDFNGNTGTESNFTAQQYGPNGIYDTLTEGSVPAFYNQYVQTNNQLHDTDIGTQSNFSAEQSAGNTYDTLTEANANGASVSYVPITITNTQSSATPNPFQEEISWNPSSYTGYEASNLGNIRFYSNSALTSPLYAWLESCTPSLSNTATSATAWIKLTSPIAANGGTLTIYMAFLSTTTTYDDNYWGEAPNLSTTYGQYDNGANVFTQYGGASWSSFTTVEGTWDTSNGYLEQTATTGNYVGGPTALIEGTSYSVSSSYVLETAVSYTAEASARVGIIADASLISGDAYGYRFIGQQGGNGAGFISFLNDWRAWVVNNAYQGTVSTPYTLQVVDNAGTWSGTLYSGYGTSGAALTMLAPTSYTAANDNGATTGYVGVSAGYFSGSTVVANPAQFQWFRMRQMPPNNVMPSASFGSIFPTPNFQLDLERQWTTASYNANSSKLLCIKTGAFSGSEALEVDVWNGAWTVLNTNLAANSWNNMSVTSYLNSASFAIRFVDADRGEVTQSSWQIGSVLLQTSNSTDYYGLDVEEQWTNVNYWVTNASLDIFTGLFSSSTETLGVQCWNSTIDSWSPLISSLNPSGWNNVSIMTYLTGSTFTIRFLSGTQTDLVQNSWQIGATVLFLNGTQVAPSSDPITIELLQNGTMLWLGQSLQMTTQAMPIPPLPVKSITVNETMNGVDSEVPFQIEDWASDYLIPLGLTSNSSVFNDGNMIVFLANSNVSKVTIWWNGSDLATQTPYAFVNRYFTGDNPGAGTLTNGRLTLQFNGNFQLTSSVGTASCTATFMRINNQWSIYGASPAYIITDGVVRDIVQQEAEWGNGVPNSPNLYSHIVITLPANATYYTYQLRVLFVQSPQSRNITDLCPIELQTSPTQTQTENGTASGYPIVSTATGTFFNQSTASAHHWSQLISGTNGAGLMFTDTGNNELYCFDSMAGTQTGGLRVNSAAGTIELLPVEMAPVGFTSALNTIWYGAVSTFSNTTPIYQIASGQVSGSWTSVEFPPTATVYTGD
jgi:hypothetical protein